MRAAWPLTVVTVAFLLCYGGETLSSDSKLSDSSFSLFRSPLNIIEENLIEPRPYPVLLRTSRQAQKTCSKNQWRCKNGQCIRRDEQCDGEVNCADGSDETFPKCRNNKCLPHLYQCTYGACADGDAECNGETNCADNSDENNKKCKPPPKQTKCSNKKFQCSSGQCINMHQLCDGAVDCNDKSDETLYQCYKHLCPSHLFRCAYGACADGDAACNNIKECEDASDEMPDLCVNATGYDGSAYTPGPRPIEITTTTTTISTPINPDSCRIPPRPQNGNYKYFGKPAIPGTQVPFWSTLLYECEKNYVLTFSSSTCDDTGVWTPDNVECIRACPNLKSTTVDFQCSYMNNPVSCDEIMKPETIVKTECKVRHIETTSNRLRDLRCIKGQWDYPVPKCIAECGEESSKATALAIGAQLEKKQGSPWHIAIYEKKPNNVHFYICGGSIVSNKMIITAAHCFHSDEKGTILPASNYAIAAGKRLSLWDSDEPLAQKSDINRIITPERYGGFEQNLQHDIAILILETILVFGDSVHPICLDLLDTVFKNRHVSPGTLGKVVGWGLTEEGDPNSASKNLLVVTLPIIDYNTCKNKMSQSFRRYLTEDKICAGYMNGTAVCKGDSGGGLVIPENERGTIRYYLRAIVSVSDLDETGTTCKKDAFTGFTNIWNHRDLIRDNMDIYS